MDKRLTRWLNKERFMQYYIRSETTMADQHTYIQGLIDMAHILESINDKEHWELHDINNRMYRENFQNSDNDN